MRVTAFFSSAAIRTAVLMCGIFFAAGLTIAAIGPSLPVLAIRVGVDIAALGGLFTTFSAGVIVAQLAIVWTSQRLGQRMTLGSSMLMMGAGGLVIAQSSGLLLLFVAALLAGAGFGGVLSMGNSLIAGLFPRQSAAALNGTNLFFGVGSILGPALAAAANTRSGAPQQAILISASILMALSLVVMITSARRSDTTASSSRDSHGAPVRSWLLSLLLLVYVGTEIGFGAWLTLYMATSTQLDTAQAALVVSGFWLALTGGRALAAMFGGRVSAHNLLMICLLGLFLSAVVLAFSIGTLGFTLVGVLLFGLSCGPVFPTVMAVVTSSTQGEKAASRALALGNIGGMLVPVLIGLLLTRIGPFAVVTLLAVTSLIMIGLAVYARRPSELSIPGSAECIATD